MVGNYFVYQRVNDLAKAGTSGYQSIDQYNRDAKQVMNEVVETLCANYEGNGAVADALEPLLVIANPTPDGSGFITKPEDFIHLDSIGTVISREKVPFNAINRNEVDSIMSSPVRRFNVAGKHLGYYKESGLVKLLPEQTFSINFRYIRQWETPFLSLIPATEDDDDYYILNPDPDATIDFELGSSMQSLIVYMMLEKLGVQMKEAILTEYANIGIQRSMIKTSPAV